MGKRKKNQPTPEYTESPAHFFVEKPISDIAEDNDRESATEAVKKKKSVTKKTKKDALARMPVAASKTHIDEQLAEIYGNRDGSLPDMSHLDVRKRRRFLSAFLVLFVSCLVLGAVVWAGFFMWQPGTQFTEDGVVVSISGNEQIAVGENVQYRIRYKNAQKLPLTQTSIQVQYPEGFVFESASVEPATDAHNEWDIGSLAEEDGGYIDITGRLFGDIGSEHSFRVFMNYQPTNFNSDFQKVSHVATRISESPLELSVALPNDIIQGIEVPVTITVKPMAGAELPKGKLWVRIDPENIFAKTKSEPKSDAVDQYQWAIDPLDKEKTITVRGVFDPKGDNTPTFAVRVFGEPADLKQKQFVYAEQVPEIHVTATEVTAQLIVNGSTTELSSHPGDTLLTRVVVKNNGASAIKNAKLKLRIDAPSVNKTSIINWPKVVDGADGTITGEQIDPATRRGEILWDSKRIASLAEIGPGKEVSFDLEIPIKSSKETDLTEFTTHRANMRLELQYPAGDTVQTLSSNGVDISLQSDVNFSMEHTGFGPGKHDISWIMTNTFHELKQIQVKMLFFGDVTPDKAALATPPVGSTVYDDLTKTLTWNIDTFPTVLDIASFEFAVTVNKVNPSQTQLTSKVQFEATDAVTGEKIIRAVDAIPLQ